MALADASGALQTRYTYDPFGQTTLVGASSSNGFEFTARENDGTGLYYYRARYYSPTLGRFIRACSHYSQRFDDECKAEKRQENDVQFFKT
jgi:RHS repeat-associated protein